VLAQAAQVPPTDALTVRMQAQYDSLRTKIPDYLQHYTEYNIPLDGAGWCPNLPCTNANAFQSRADALRSAITRFKSYVDARTGPDVWSIHITWPTTATQALKMVRIPGSNSC